MNSPDSPFLPHGGYRKLRSYKVAEAVYDATVVFCRRFCAHDRRMTDQMVQAARSGVRNISEGSGAAATSRKSEMKLTNVARASLSDELLRDYESFLTQNGLRVWAKDSREALAMRARLAKDHASGLPPGPAGRVRLQGLGGLSEFVQRAAPELAANAMLCMVNQAAYLLKRQLESQGRTFVESGGFTEKLYGARIQAKRSDRSDKSDKSDGYACPVCGKSMLRRTARKGPKIGQSFWGCSGFPDCKGILPLSLLLLVMTANGQEGVKVSGGFKFGPGGYYPPPHEKQLKSLLTGARAEPQPGGMYLITDAKFETFLEDGQPEMLVESPQCLYNERGDQTVHSEGPLSVKAADGKFSIAGDGFRWQTNSTLFISNRVHTIVHPELLQPQTPNARTNKPAPDEKGIEIFSEHFDYAGDNGIGNYRSNVQVKGTDLDMTAARLQFLLPMKPPRQLQRLTAEENVVVNSGEVQAKGQHLNYAPETGIIHISGEPSWEAVPRKGHGDELSIDRSNHIFRAIGHAYLEMPGEGAVGFFPAATAASTNSLSASNQIVEIKCVNYEIQTNSANFQGPVLVTDRAGEQIQGTLSCGQMTATFSGTNQMERMVARENVIIAQESKRFTADKAVFTGTNGILELTGNPKWQDGTREGKGDTLLMEVRRNELLARENASLRLPAEALGASERQSVRASEGEESKFADILAREYRLGTNSAFFQGGVRVIHPQMKLNCKTLSFDVPEGTQRAQTMVAQDSVDFDLVDEKGQKIRGTGQKAVYTYSATAASTNDLVELTGDAMLTMTNGSSFKNSIIILDRTNGKVMAPGKYIIHGVATASASVTNTAFSPKAKSKKKKAS